MTFLSTRPSLVISWTVNALEQYLLAVFLEFIFNQKEKRGFIWP